MEGAMAPNGDTACVASPHSTASAQPASAVDIREPQHVQAPRQAASSEARDTPSLTVAEVAAEAVELREPTDEQAAGDQQEQLGTRCCSSSSSDTVIEIDKPSPSSSCADGQPGKGVCCNVSSGKLVEEAECRICLSADSPAALLSPCHCTGTVRYAHMACLLRWCVERASTRCEICGASYSAEVLPLLEAEVKAQRQAMQREAELARARLRQAEAEAAAAGMGVSPERGPSSSSWLLLKMLLVLCVTGGLLYAIFFLGSQDGGSLWAAVLLRVLIFIIPVYLVYRGVKACLQHRSHIVVVRSQIEVPPGDMQDRRPPIV